MADVSFVEFKTRVAKRLQLIAETEDLPVEYGDDIGLASLSVQAQVAELGIGAFDLENGIDHRYVDVVADLVAAELADEFNLPEPRRSMVKSQALGLPGRSMAERRLRLLFPSPKKQTTHDMPVL